MTNKPALRVSRFFVVCGLFPVRNRRRASEDVGETVQPDQTRGAKCDQRLPTTEEPAVRHEELSVGQETLTRDHVLLDIFTRENVLKGQMLDVALFGVRTMLRLERDAWSVVK